MSEKTPEQKARHNERRFKKRNPDKEYGGYVRSDQTRERMSEVAGTGVSVSPGFTDHNHTTETKEQISLTLLGKESGFKGHTHTQESKDSISTTLKNKVLKEDHGTQQS